MTYKYLHESHIYVLVSTGTDFTLEKLVEIGLDQHAELVGDISSAASKELAIEQVRMCTSPQVQ